MTGRFAPEAATGRNLEDESSVTELGNSLGITEPHKRISAPAIKKLLQDNTKEAIASGAFGVPSFVVDGELFWGDDATEMLLSYLNDRALSEVEEMKRISNLPIGLDRQRQLPSSRNRIA